MGERRRPVAGAVGAIPILVALVAGAGCGVDIDATGLTSTTTTAPPSDATTTTGEPSDDELVVLLEANGYTREEAECAAAALRDELTDEEIDGIVETDDLEDFDESIADDFADAVNPCLDGGSDDG
jgi:hypothetical protein